MQRNTFGAVAVLAVVALLVGWTSRTSAGRADRAQLALGLRALPKQVLRPAGAPLRPVVVLYADASCEHCHVQLARLDSILRTMPAVALGIDFVLIAPSRLGALVEAVPSVHFRQFTDSAGLIRDSLHIRAIPTMLIARADGSVEDVTIGETSLRDLLKKLNSLRMTK
jgi:hypothetical protein